MGKTQMLGTKNRGTKNRVYLLPLIILGFVLLSLASSQNRAKEHPKLLNTIHLILMI